MSAFAAGQGCIARAYRVRGQLHVHAGRGGRERHAREMTDGGADISARGQADIQAGFRLGRYGRASGPRTQEHNIERRAGANPSLQGSASRRAVTYEAPDGAVAPLLHYRAWTAAVIWIPATSRRHGGHGCLHPGEDLCQHHGRINYGTA